MNDGLLDCPALFTDLTPVLCACFEKILNIIRTLLAWNGFLAQDQKPMLREILVILSKGVSASPIRFMCACTELLLAFTDVDNVQYYFAFGRLGRVSDSVSPGSVQHHHQHLVR